MMKINEDSPWVDDMTRKVVAEVNAGKIQHHPPGKNSMRRYADRTSGKRWMSVEGEIKELMKKDKMFRNKATFLNYLLQESSWKGKKDKHNTYDDWYIKRDKIVASIGETKMMMDTGVPRSTLKDWLRVLEEKHLIQREYENGELIIVLGRVIDGVDVFFYEIF